MTNNLHDAIDALNRAIDDNETSTGRLQNIHIARNLIKSCLTQQPQGDKGEVVVIDDFVGVIDEHSKNIHFFGYLEKEKLMRIEFKNGHQFNYQDIPKDVFNGMALSLHRGKYLHEEIKGNYRYYRVNGD